jgi:hypothetical protein
MEAAEELGKPPRRWIVLLSAAAIAAFCVLVGVGILAALGASPMIADALAAAAGGRCCQKERAIYVDLLHYHGKIGTLPVGDSMRATLSLSRISSANGPDPAFFGRDMLRFPIEKFPGDASEPLIACNKNALEHHPDVVHVLFADGAIKTLALDDLKAQGEVPPDTTELVVGPNSAHADLRRMRRD